ncbi:nitroreductase [Nordella sp. HKS 07]|uniref:nitroreductase family protein n=1 Tax=Nordella sp. HKS 07 TaxID=2712222 RepID=UPI0013E1952E|nr:nitroreductase [Nordella sp. HKS 07]QIG51584.1 nitroreductase [Nordella sp. HKS 07]
MTSLNDTSSALSLLKTRKSASVKTMGAPGPTAQQLQTILDIAVRVPDHGKLAPWRFVLFEGEARGKFGDVLKTRWQTLHPEHGADSLEFQRNLFLRAPTVIVVVSKAAPHVKIPEWEQLLSAGALTQNMLLAAAALGIGAQWNTDWIAYDQEIAKAMGLSETEKVVGIVYFGTPQAPLEDRPRPDPQTLVTRWHG